MSGQDLDQDQHSAVASGRHKSSGSSKTERLSLAAALIFTFFVRGTVLWVMRGNLQQDPDAYREIAENLLQHGEFALGKGDPPHPTAFRPPLYPVVLSNLPAADGLHVSLAKVAALHLMLGLATVWLTWLTARRVGSATVGRAGQPTVATIAPVAIAALVVACDPILLNQQTLLMTETLAAFLAILSLWCLARFEANRSWFNAGLAGGAVGLAVLCRPTFLPWLGLVAAAMFVVRGKNSEFRIQNSERDWLGDYGWRVANVAGLLIAAGAVVSPWAIRNYRVFGKPIVTTTHGGYTLLLGNNPSFYGWLINDKTGLPWNATDLTLGSFEARNLWIGQSAESLSFLSEGELEYDKQCYELGTNCIREEPASCLRASFYRLRQLWSPLPHKLTADESTARRLQRYATCIWYCGVYVLAAIGIWRLRWKLVQPPWLWGVLLCFAFTAVHTFYWTNLRMRAPLMPFVAIVAGAAFSARRRQ